VRRPKPTWLETKLEGHGSRVVGSHSSRQGGGSRDLPLLANGELHPALPFPHLLAQISRTIQCASLCSRHSSNSLAQSLKVQRVLIDFLEHRLLPAVEPSSPGRCPAPHLLAFVTSFPPFPPASSLLPSVLFGELPRLATFCRRASVSTGDWSGVLQISKEQ